MKKLICLILFLSSTYLYANQILIITDMHFNPVASCSNFEQCPLYHQLINAPLNQWQQLLSQDQQTTITKREDTNFVLWNSTLTELATLKQKGELKPDLILVLGDILPHKVLEKLNDAKINKQQQAEYLIKNYQYVLTSLHAVFPTVPMTVALGNNDSLTKDYISLPRQAFLQQYADLQKKLAATILIDQSHLTDGYYTARLPNVKNNWLVVLNTNYFSSKSAKLHLLQQNVAAHTELAWLNHTLAEARKQHVHVWLAMHIPPAIDEFNTSLSPLGPVLFWNSHYRKKFLALTQNYSDVISGGMAGHMHMDSFFILKNQQQATMFMIITPAISPIFGNNPAFKIAKFSSNSQQIQDLITYNLPLKQKNPQIWQKEYSFNEAYHVPITLTGLLQLTNSLSFKQGALRQLYVQYFSVQSNIVQAYMKLSWNVFYCAIQNEGKNNFNLCRNQEWK